MEYNPFPFSFALLGESVNAAPDELQNESFQKPSMENSDVMPSTKEHVSHSLQTGEARSGLEV